MTAWTPPPGPCREVICPLVVFHSVTTELRAPAASVTPSLANATQVTGAGCFGRAARSRLEATSHSLTVPPAAVTRVLLSGLNTRAFTGSVSFPKTVNAIKVPGSLSFTARSSPAVARSRPFGANATEVTAPW